jgi:hypothetical protein
MAKTSSHLNIVLSSVRVKPSGSILRTTGLKARLKKVNQSQGSRHKDNDRRQPKPKPKPNRVEGMERSYD